MKRLLIVFLIFLSYSSFAQEVKTQNHIMQLPDTDLVKDFYLKTNGNIKPITVTKTTYTDIGFGYVEKKFSYLKTDYSNKTLTFKGNKLSSSVTIFNSAFGKPRGFHFYYYYNEKGVLKSSKSKTTNAGVLDDDEENNHYSFNNDNLIKEIKFTGKEKTTITKYNSTKNSISYDFANGKTNYTIKNGLITEVNTFNKSANKNYINTYKYNSKGYMIHSKTESSQSEYTLNNNNLIEKAIEDNYTQYFKYEYDKYGNWIIAYQLAVSNKDYDGNVTEPHLYGSKFSFYIREIKYSNGDITGGKTPEDINIKEPLLNARNELYYSLIEVKATFSKTANESYLFKLNDQQEAKNTTSVFMGQSLLVFHKPSKQLFILEDFENKPEGKYFPVKKVSIDLKDGFWFKTQKGGVHVFRKDGSYIKEVGTYEYAENNTDALFQGKNEPEKVVLKDYKNVEILTPYSVSLYSDYNEGGISGISKNAEKLANSLEKYSEYFVGKCLKGDCENGYGEKEFQDGKKAEGFFKDGQPFGPMHTSDKKNNKSLFGNYNGSFQDKVGFTYEYDGKNMSIYSDKSKNTGFYNDYETKKTYILYFNNGKVTSKKELTYNDSKTCVVGNCYNGTGIYVYNNGATYMGTFTNGKRNGFGTLFYNNGDQYIGEFYNDNYNGLGTYIWSGSEFTYYMGNYNNGKYHGKGVLYYSKDKFDAGNWTNGKLDSQKTTTSNAKSNSSSSTNTNSKGFNIFSLEQKNKILACNNDSDCTADYISSLNSENGVKLSGQQLTKKTTDYFHSLHTMNPELAYNILFKIHYSQLDIKSLPEEVQKDLRNRAKGLADGYKKFKKDKGY